MEPAGQRGELSVSITRVEKWCAGVAVLMIAASLIWWNLRISLSLFAGVAISAGSFFLLHVLVSQAIKRSGIKRAALLVALIAKFGLVGWALWFVVTQLPIQTLAFMIGLSSVILSTGIEACYVQCGVKDV
jgi:hypothetical protein